MMQTHVRSCPWHIGPTLQTSSALKRSGDSLSALSSALRAIFTFGGIALLCRCHAKSLSGELENTKFGCPFSAALRVSVSPRYVWVLDPPSKYYPLIIVPNFRRVDTAASNSYNGQWPPPPSTQ